MSQPQLRVREIVDAAKPEPKNQADEQSRNADRPLIERLPKRPLGLKQGN